MTVVKSLEDLDVSSKCVTNSSGNETKVQRDGFLGMLN